MKATEILQSITDALSVNLSEEVTLSEMKLKNGTVLEAEEFASENEVFIKTDDEKVPLPEGSYELEDGRILVVVDEGIINEIKSETEEEMKEDLEEAPEVKEEEKAELEYATKEELNEVKSIVEEIKAMLDPKEEEVDASVVEAKEEIEELKAELAKPATQPLKHSPESSTERKMNLYSQKGALTTLDKVMQKISNFK
tara:strand:+ start:4002 stop:4595 length:594 start_codon:yes stop_codon:yes gene_type:complete